jgi:GntP family gluconate:H+ symporter
MTPEDYRLLLAAVAGIALSILLLVRARLHPFVALLTGAFAVGLIAGLPIKETAAAVQKGAGDILGGTGLVVALGLGIGAMLQISDGAAGIARGALRLSGPKGAPWSALAAAVIIGLPLFFETGLVLLGPIVATAALSLPAEQNGVNARLRLMMPALAGLSVVHGLAPPHPGPLLAVSALNADLGRTMIYGLIVSIPTAIVAGGPWLANLVGKGVKLAPPVFEPIEVEMATPPVWRAMIVVLAPVLLIAAGQILVLAPNTPHLAWLGFASNPVVALLLTSFIALPLLFGRRMFDAPIQGAIWTDAMKPAGTILLAIGAGGALKQVLVSAGLSDLLVRVTEGAALSPLLIAWLVSACIRLAVGSATVATITTAGVMSSMVVATGASAEWTVLAIGAGSLFFSHVNDPGFWLVKSYLGADTPGMFRTWSVMETVISVTGLLLVLTFSQFF